jgi:hypothetical protein
MEFLIPLEHVKLLSNRDKLAESDVIFLSNQNNCKRNRASIGLTHLYLFLHKISLGPVKNQWSLIKALAEII